MEVPQAGRHRLHLALVERQGEPPLKSVEYELRLSGPRPLRPAHLVAPLVGLECGVACADGTLENVQVKVMNDAVECPAPLDAASRRQLEGLLGHCPAADIRPLLHRLRDRLPALPPEAVVARMADVVEHLSPRL